MLRRLLVLGLVGVMFLGVALSTREVPRGRQQLRASYYVLVLEPAGRCRLPPTRPSPYVFSVFVPEVPRTSARCGPGP